MEEAHESHNDENPSLQSNPCSAGGDGLAGRRGGLFGPEQGGHAFVWWRDRGAIRPDQFEFATLWSLRRRCRLVRVEQFQVLRLQRQHKNLGPDQPERPERRC